MINEKSITPRPNILYISDPETDDETRNRALRPWLVLAAWLGVLVLLLQGLWQSRVPLISNIFVPDSVIIFNGVLSSPSSGLGMRGFGLQVFYYPFYALDARLLFIPNMVMWLGSVWAAHRLFWRHGPRAAQFAIIAILFNPYLLLAISGPTKELPLVFLVLLFLLLEPAWRKLPYFLPIIVITYFIRDGYGVVMGGWLVLHLLLPKRYIPAGRVVLCLVPLVMLLGHRDYTSNVPGFNSLVTRGETLVSLAQGSRIGVENIQRSLQTLDEPLLAAREYGFRLAANAYSHLVRPALFTISGRLSLLGLGYFIHALFLALGISATILSLFSTARKEQHVAYLTWFILLFWSVVSLNLFIHPRYLMPITPVAMGIFGVTDSGTRRIITLAVLSFALLGVLFLYFAFGIEPAVSVDNLSVPPYFIGAR